MSAISRCSCLALALARALSTSGGNGFNLISSNFRGNTSLVTWLACAVFAKLKSDRFAIFGKAKVASQSSANLKTLLEDGICEGEFVEMESESDTEFSRTRPFPLRSFEGCSPRPKLSRSGPEFESDRCTLPIDSL